jgi:hypothetical protein
VAGIGEDEGTLKGVYETGRLRKSGGKSATVW